MQRWMRGFINKIVSSWYISLRNNFSVMGAGSRYSLAG